MGGLWRRTPMKPYKQRTGRQLELFCCPFRERIRREGNRYTAIRQAFNPEIYRLLVEDAVRQERIRTARSRRERLEPVRGRLAFDPVWMLECMILQRLLGLSDEAFCHRLNVDVELQDYLEIAHTGDIPSPKTLWKYHEIFSRHSVMEAIFDHHIGYIKSVKEEVGTKAIAIDSSFLEAPKQRNTREENALIKQGKGHTLWNDNPHKKCHKDCDARWTKKRQEVHYGYKIHATVCTVSKLIVNVFTTSASVHDAKVVEQMVPDNDTGNDAFLFADAGYIGSDIEKMVWEKHWVPFICEKGFRNQPLTDEQKTRNRMFSSIRCRVEHVFGFIQQSMGGSFVRSVGIMRAGQNAALTCLVYNVSRLLQLFRSEPQPKVEPKPT